MTDETVDYYKKTAEKEIESWKTIYPSYLKTQGIEEHGVIMTYEEGPAECQKEADKIRMEENVD